MNGLNDLIGEEEASIGAEKEVSNDDVHSTHSPASSPVVQSLLEEPLEPLHKGPDPTPTCFQSIKQRQKSEKTLQMICLCHDTPLELCLALSAHSSPVP